MFAVLKTGGKQYTVRPGDVLKIEKLAAEAGDKIQFNEILMLGGETAIPGTPLVADAAVQAEVLDQIRGEKLIHYVRRRRKHSSQRRKGHRQYLTVVRVTDILAEGAGKSGVKAAVGAGSVPRAAVAPAPAAKPAAAKKAPAAKAAAPEAAPGTRPANLLEAARTGGADDLKKISGVGPKLEGLLNANGVYHYDQIAAWSADEVAYMDDKLSFKGRIERDDWIGQARALAAGKE